MFPWPQIGDVSGWVALVGVTLWGARQFAAGRWISLRQHQETVAERDAWKEAAQTALEASAKQAGLMDDVRIVLRANASLVRAATEPAAVDGH